MPDMVIVGGGVIGAACAFELAACGASVTLVERDHLAAHASGRNHGLWLLPYDDVNVPMARASLDAYRRLVPEAPLDVRLDTEPVGTVLVASSAQEARLAEPNATASPSRTSARPPPSAIASRRSPGTWPGPGSCTTGIGSIPARSPSRSPWPPRTGGPRSDTTCTRAAWRCAEEPCGESSPTKG